MAIEFTARINPIGTTAERRLESTVSQLRLQNEQLQAIIKDLYRENEQLQATIKDLYKEIERLKKGNG